MNLPLKNLYGLFAFFVVINFNTTTSNAQIQSLDNLEAAYKQGSEQERLIALSQIADYYYTIDRLDSFRNKKDKLEIQISKSSSDFDLSPLLAKMQGKIAYKDGKYDEASKILDSIAPQLALLDNKTPVVDALVFASKSYNILNKNDDAIQQLILAEKYASDIHLQAIYNAYAQIYLTLNDTKQALNYLNKASSISQVFNNKSENAITYQTYANLNYQLQDFKEAIRYYKKAEKYYKTTSNYSGLFLVTNNAGDAASKLGDNKLARKKYKQALEYSKYEDNPYREAIVKVNIAYEEGLQGNLKEAVRLYKEGIAVFKEVGAPGTQSIVLTRLGSLYLDYKDYPNAIKYANQAAVLADENDNDALRKDAKSLLASVYKNQGELDKAIVLQDEILTLAENIYKKELTTEVEAQRETFDVIQKESELLLKEQEITALKNAQRQRNIIYTLGGLGLLLGLAFSYRSYTLVKTKKKVLEAEQSLSALKQEQLRDTVKEKKGQVTNFALHIKEKNELLEALKTSITKVKSTTKEKEVKNALQAILLNISVYKSMNQERVDLLSGVEENAGDFLTTLNNRFPRLTEREKSIASLIRLNMNSKEIASYLNISVMSLNNVRSGIRKKMGLQKQDKLPIFLQQL